MRAERGASEATIHNYRPWLRHFGRFTQQTGIESDDLSARVNSHTADPHRLPEAGETRSPRIPYIQRGVSIRTVNAECPMWPAKHDELAYPCAFSRGLLLCERPCNYKTLDSIFLASSRIAVRSSSGSRTSASAPNDSTHRRTSAVPATCRVIITLPSSSSSVV